MASCTYIGYMIGLFCGIAIGFVVMMGIIFGYLIAKHTEDKKRRKQKKENETITKTESI